MIAKTAVEIESEIQAELRSIVRLRERLLNPIGQFLPHAERQGPSRFFAVIHDIPTHDINGLRLRARWLGLPDERLLNEVGEFAKAVWHLKDRLNAWTDHTGQQASAEHHARKSKDLLITADLANAKKHGEHRNRSKLQVLLDDVVQYRVSENGVVELYLDGTTRQFTLIVEHPVPIEIRVPVHSALLGADLCRSAPTIIASAFEHWQPWMRSVSLLSSNDPQTSALRSSLGWN